MTVELERVDDWPFEAYYVGVNGAWVAVVYQFAGAWTRSDDPAKYRSRDDAVNAITAAAS